MPEVRRCDHERGHSGRGRFVEHHGRLRFLLVCDDCGAERREVQSIAYTLNPKPFANSLAELTAKELGLEPALVARVRLAAILCDVGNAQIPTEILEKPGPLDAAEWHEVFQHPELGAALLSGTSFDDIREWILAHHERPDGTGYPRGLGGDEIPLEARVLSVIEAYDAMISDRPYRRATSHQDACAELRRNAGTQFDREVVAAFLRAVARYRLRLDHMPGERAA